MRKSRFRGRPTDPGPEVTGVARRDRRQCDCLDESSERGNGHHGKTHEPGVTGWCVITGGADDGWP